MSLQQTTRRNWRIASLLSLPIVLLILVSSVSLSGQQPGAAAPHSAVRIMSPKEGEVLSINIVHCKYQLVEPVSADSSPTYRIQLDDRDPVRTSMTDHTFTGLKEGPHELFVIVVDANDTPIPGTRAAAHFKVSLAQPHSGSAGAAAPAGRAAKPRPNLLLVAAKRETRAGQSSSAAAPDEAKPAEGTLPDGSSPLPLLAVLCGGALAGGTLSVIRTRGRRTRG